MNKLTLILCKPKLAELGIDMEAVGGGDKLTIILQEKLEYTSWEYDYLEDKIMIWADLEVFPDMSELGEVAPDDTW
ncbi:hypothetical protein [Peribacillus kribbensis]|uniref:hypothetical protein n=1 Tax=Peribacillus kribbensis TaxID=356658 RepID=UPI0004290B07|nr:hypothetical protein [Peribacillus kribbensis]